MNLEKVGAEMSYLQSQMHSDDASAESIADSDLDAGELRKMLASPLYRQDQEDCKSARIPIAPKKPAAMIQERGAIATRTQADHSRRESLTLSSSQVPRALGKPAAMFASGSQDLENQPKSSFFRNANPSNLRGSLLEGNQDHLLSQARSELMRQEHQVGSIVSVSFSNKPILKDWSYRTLNTDSEILKSEICTEWEKL